LVTPFVIGLVSPVLMLLAAIGLIGVLVWFDRGPTVAGDTNI
jgi:hypothetical protein